MTAQNWFQLVSNDVGVGTQRLTAPLILRVDKDRALDKNQSINLLDLIDPEFDIPRSLIIGQVKEHQGNFMFHLWGESNADLDLKVYHHRENEQELIEEFGVELWPGDVLWIEHPTFQIELVFEADEVDPGEVVAERSISDVNVYADRVFQSQDRIHTLFQHTTKLGQSSSLDETLKASALMVFDLLPRATHVAIALKLEREKRYPVLYSAHRSGGDVDLPMSRTLIKRVIERRSSLLLMNASEEVGGAMSVLAAGLVSTLCVPLWVGANICGVLQVDNRDTPGAFSTADLELITVAASTLSFAAESARLIERLSVAEEQLKGGLLYLQHNERREASGLIGESVVMQTILKSIERVKDLKVPVFINGETGTGKELIARALHYQSVRREGLFVAQNCGALPESLLESELFGHVKGAFTGADRDKKGLFELAHRGSIFLDEVGEMPPQLQSKLLRALQEGEIWPLGADRSKRVDVRVISATHRNLDVMVKEGEFRQDLYYRLHVYPIHLPPLRDRGQDISLITKHFLRRYAQEFGRGVSGFSEEALRCLLKYDWPGNVRELQNEIQRALISRFEGDLILKEDLSAHISGIDADSGDVMRETLNVQGTLKEMMEHLEILLLQRALEDHDHNKTQTAKTLGITREGLHKKLARYSM